MQARSLAGLYTDGQEATPPQDYVQYMSQLYSGKENVV